MIVVGITGPIGSGKSEVVDHLKNKGYLCLVEDRIASCIRESDEVRCKISERFNGVTDADSLRRMVKDDPSKLIFLNELIHPLVFDYVKSVIESSDEKVIFIESALPKEARFDELCDRVWYVDSDYEKRLERVRRSRRISDEEFHVLDMRQKFDDIKITDVINNDKEIDDLYKNIDEVVNGIL